MDLITRLNTFFKYTGKNLSQFAEVANTPKGSLSQILNGRNQKISNELISKLHTAFPNLNIMWLLFGEGSMLMADETRSDGKSAESAAGSTFDRIDANVKTPDLFNTDEKPAENLNVQSTPTSFEEPAENPKTSFDEPIEKSSEDVIPQYTANKTPQTNNTNKVTQTQASEEINQFMTPEMKENKSLEPSFTTSEKTSKETNQKRPQEASVGTTSETTSSNSRTISKIIIFYSDHTLEVYNNGEILK